jgi:hypothetical protein
MKTMKINFDGDGMALKHLKWEGDRGFATLVRTNNDGVQARVKPRGAKGYKTICRGNHEQCKIAIEAWMETPIQ